MLGVRSRHAATLRCPTRLDQVGGRERRGAPHADLPRADEIGQRVDRLADVGRWVGPVDLIQVDVVGAEAAQAALDRRPDPAPRVAAMVRVVVHRVVELRGEHHVVAATGESPTDDLLALAVRVHVGGVDEVDPGIDGAIDQTDAVVVIGVPPRAEHHRAEAEA